MIKGSGFKIELDEEKSLCCKKELLNSKYQYSKFNNKPKILFYTKYI